MILKFYDSQTEFSVEITKVYPFNQVKEGGVLFEYKYNSECKKYFYPLNVKITKFLLDKGSSIKNGDAIAEIASQKNSNFNKKYVDDKIWELAVAVNASFKGLLASMGESGQIAKKAIPFSTSLDIHTGIEDLIEQIGLKLKGAHLEDGDVIVIAEKPFPVSERRLIPINLILNKNDPKKLDKKQRKALKEKCSDIIKDKIDDEDLILADCYDKDPKLGKMATIGASDHNLLAAKCATSVKKHTGKLVDVIISDTDTGMDIRQSIIGCITITATPVGATKGVNLYECMRASSAAEFCRGSDKNIPIVICKPADRCRVREGIGNYRGYSRKLQLSCEKGITYA